MSIPVKIFLAEYIIEITNNLLEHQNMKYLYVYFYK